MNLVTVPELDAPKLIDEMLATGMTMADLATKIGVPFNTIKRWRSGSNPRWHHGHALLILHGCTIAQQKQVDKAFNPVPWPDAQSQK